MIGIFLNKGVRADTVGKTAVSASSSSKDKTGKRKPSTVKEGWVPKVGDKVIALKNPKYCITDDGWKGVITELGNNGYAYIQDRDGYETLTSVPKGFHVLLDYFVLDI